jgi:hypothetical protein
MIFLNSINQIVFVIDKQFVLCKVGNRFLNINLLAPKFYFAHPVYKMQKYRTKKR